jgi:hypothetical protein
VSRKQTFLFGRRQSPLLPNQHRPPPPPLVATWRGGRSRENIIVSAEVWRSRIQHANSLVDLSMRRKRGLQTLGPPASQGWESFINFLGPKFRNSSPKCCTGTAATCLVTGTHRPLRVKSKLGSSGIGIPDLKTVKLKLHRTSPDSIPSLPDPMRRKILRMNPLTAPSLMF